ncbi:MAG TPA: TMEM175 family protein [Terriglobales bacterium]|jgi:uncharacterized membrane protein|nr:TMEM175 family protein [Terriglobales bacterium]
MSMFREGLVGVVPAEKGFRWRGAEITRLEGFSDAVFAFAVTLLVVSLEVPKDFPELLETMRGFTAFAICFALLAHIWSHHYRFFRRYGLQTPWANFLNCALLFFVLFYVYPLKFLFNLALRRDLRLEAGDARSLFVIYGCGYAAVFLLLALLYLHAWKKREELVLTELERVRTWRSLLDHIAMVVIGLVSALLAWLLPLRWVGMAGYFYFVIAPYYTVAGFVLGKRDRQARASAAAH